MLFKPNCLQGRLIVYMLPAALLLETISALLGSLGSYFIDEL